MKLGLIGRMAGAILLTASLAGCLDMTEEISITSETTAKATMTMTMGADVYSMMKSADAAATKDSEKFCSKEGEALTENADGSATCVSSTEGNFDTLNFDEGGSKPVFTSAGPGLVKVSVPTKDMMGDMGKETDPQTAAMMKQMFDNHFLTIRISGVEVTDTNMTLSDDKTAAEIKVPFTGLLDGSAKLPDELYAVVKTN